MVRELRPGMNQTFAEAIDSWIFCGSRLLNHKLERAAALARTADQEDIVRKMAERLKDEVARDALRDRVVVPQVAGSERYTGPLVGGRFQVLESFLPAGTFYVVDHELPDLVVRVAGAGSDTRRFATVADAEAHVSLFTSPDERVIDVSSSTLTKRTATMARTAAKTKNEPKAGRETLPKAGRGRKAALPAPPAPEPTVKAGRGRKAAPVPATVTDIGGRAPRTGVGARTKELIGDGLSNAEIVKILDEEFPSNRNSAGNVNWYRNKLKNG